MSGNAVAGGSRLRMPASWVRALAFGTAARQESCGVSSAASPTRSDDAKSGEFADKTVTGYTPHAHRQLLPYYGNDPRGTVLHTNALLYDNICMTVRPADLTWSSP